MASLGSLTFTTDLDGDGCDIDECQVQCVICRRQIVKLQLKTLTNTFSGPSVLHYGAKRVKDDKGKGELGIDNLQGTSATYLDKRIKPPQAWQRGLFRSRDLFVDVFPSVSSLSQGRCLAGILFGWELINTAISRIISEVPLDSIVLDHLERQLGRGLIWLVMPSRARLVCNCHFSTSHLQPLSNPFVLLSIKHYLFISLIAPMTIEIALSSTSFFALKCVSDQMAQTSP
ncbi:hypothetical protein BJX65DRAFT_43170 [Aspergillus insuetus]